MVNHRIPALSFDINDRKFLIDANAMQGFVISDLNRCRKDFERQSVDRSFQLKLVHRLAVRGR